MATPFPLALRTSSSINSRHCQSGSVAALPKWQCGQRNIYGHLTISPTRWPTSIGCASQSLSSSTLPSSHIKSSTDTRRVPWPFDMHRQPTKSRHCLHSVATNYLILSSITLSAVGSRPFVVVSPHIWSDLLEYVM